jgi:hypothetical protein
VNTAGKSLTWDELADLRDQGFEIGNHSVSHLDLRRKPSKATGTYEEWLKSEIEDSKKLLEGNLGIRCATFAYPFGLNNQTVRDAVKAAGHTAGFTTYGMRLGIATDPMALGRYDVTTKDVHGRDSFTVGISFEGMMAPSAGPMLAQEAAASMITEPMNNATINDPMPTIKANLSTMGQLDDGTVQMRISGIGLVKAQYDPESKNITYKPTKPLQPGDYTVIIGAKSNGVRAETKWSFVLDPKAAQ